MEAQSTKSERIDFRVTPEEKKLFQEAQRMSGDRSISGYIIRVVKDVSAKILKEREKVLASDRDRKIFFDAIFTDHEPNETLKNAAEKFKKSQV